MSPNITLPSLNSKAVVIPGSAKVMASVFSAKSLKTGCGSDRPSAPTYRVGKPSESKEFAMIGPLPPSLSNLENNSMLALLPAAALIRDPRSDMVSMGSKFSPMPCRWLTGVTILSTKPSRPTKALCPVRVKVRSSASLSVSSAFSISADNWT